MGNKYLFCIVLLFIVNLIYSQDVINSSIDGDFDGFDSDELFKLMNGQIWQQDEYKYNYSYKYNPRVTITKMSGGYFMKVDGMDELVRVKLISGTVLADGKYIEFKAIESYIVNDFSGYGSDKLFKLSNGQIWEQAEYKYNYSYMYRPKVTIIKVSSGFKMMVDGMSEDVMVRQVGGN